MNPKTLLLVLILADLIVPLPFLAPVLLWVLFAKPPWFRRFVDDLYAS